MSLRTVARSEMIDDSVFDDAAEPGAWIATLLVDADLSGKAIGHGQSIREDIDKLPIRILRNKRDWRRKVRA